MAQFRKLQPFLALALTVPMAMAQAYEVEIRCGANGRLEGHRFISAPLEQAIASNASSLSDEAVQAICGDVEQCWRQFRSIARVSRQTSEILQAAQYEDARRAGDELRAGAVRGALERLKRFLDSCFGAIGGRGTMGEAGTVTLLYPFEGPSASKTSNRYSERHLRSLAELAIRNGVDPYLAIAVAVLENPPLEAGPQRGNVENRKGLSPDAARERYIADYGVMPVDAIGAFDALGCRQSRTAGFDLDRASISQLARQVRQGQSLMESVATLFRSSPDLGRFDSARNRVSNLERQIEDTRARPYYPMNPLSRERQEELKQEELVRLQQELEEERRIVAELQPRLVPLVTRLDDLRRQQVRVQLETNEIETSIIRRFPPEQAFNVKDAIACARAPAECAGVITGQDRVPQLTLTPLANAEPSRVMRVCSHESTIRTGASPTFVHGANHQGNDRRCCADIRVSEQDYVAARVPAHLRGAVQSTDAEPRETPEFTRMMGGLNATLGMIHLRNITQASIGRGRSLSWALQGYNGRGVMGSTERVNNVCLNGVNMNQTPVYGAKAADVVVNMAMNNPEVRRIVTEAQRSEGRPVLSVLCMDKGQPGTYRIAADQFLREQRRYLLESGEPRRSACQARFRNSQLAN